MRTTGIADALTRNGGGSVTGKPNDVALEEAMASVLAHPRFVRARYDYTRPDNVEVTILAELGGERTITGSPGVVWYKVRHELVHGQNRIVRGSLKRRDF